MCVVVILRCVQYFFFACKLVVMRVFMHSISNEYITSDVDLISGKLESTRKRSCRNLRYRHNNKKNSQRCYLYLVYIFVFVVYAFQTHFTCTFSIFYLMKQFYYHLFSAHQTNVYAPLNLLHLRAALCPASTIIRLEFRFLSKL